jgi:hypothetical protein
MLSSKSPQASSQDLDEFSARYLEMLKHGALSLREGKLEEGFAELLAAVKQEGRPQVR